MPVAPKVAGPLPNRASLPLPALARSVEAGVTLLTAPAGYLPAAHLAALLAERGGACLWLRLGPEDRDPATLLTTFVAALHRQQPTAGRATLEQMRRHPGPLLGWPALFAGLAQELAALLGADGSLVLEDCQPLGDAYQTLQLLSAYVLAALAPGVCCILTAERALPPGMLPRHTTFVDARDLRVERRIAEALPDAIGLELPAATIRRVVELADGRAGMLLALHAATAQLGPAPIRQAIERAGTLGELQLRIARAALAMMDAPERQALGLAERLGYIHPCIREAALGSSGPLHGPWCEALDDDWTLLQPLWRAPLYQALNAPNSMNRTALERAVAHMVELGAVDHAVLLYFELGDRSRAAATITRALERYVSLGHWATLEEWLSQLPAATLAEWPALVYVSGELAAAQGQLAAAQQHFSLASRLFAARRDAAGWCQSLLAESALAAWHGDLARAEVRAQTAAIEARNANLLWQNGWAAWQLGCLAVAADDLDKALVYFDQAQEIAASLNDELMLTLPRQAELLVLRRRDLHRQSEYHRAAYLAAEQAEREAADQLRLLLVAPQHNVEALLENHGWARLPLMLKLLAPAPEQAALPLAEGNGLWRRLLGLLGLQRIQPPPTRIDARFVAPAAADSTGALQTLDHPPVAAREAHNGHAAAELAREFGAAPVEPPAAEPAPQPVAFAVYMLGTFHVSVNERAVEAWPSGRGRTVLKYLLAQRVRPVPRDVLMDFFWPDSSPEAARNSLNVAIHGLRQAFRTVTTTTVVQFENGAYRLNPDLAIWVDVEAFERHVAAGRQLEAQGELQAAAAEYERAVALYRADFLIDDPYEDWPVLTRERLRMLHLEALEHLGQITFAQGRYAACIDLCQRMLNADSCHEEAHCRLMRCYARLGQHPSALRQYQTCVEALRSELDVAPAPTTIDLYERIRRREPV
jgi:DNA-binding SARP family transcriptional activator